MVSLLRRETSRLFKADLHVHSRYSGSAKPRRFFRCLDCYSPPLDIYRQAKRRGLDLVTSTAHGSMDGSLELLKLERQRVEAYARSLFSPPAPSAEGPDPFALSPATS